MASNVDSPEKTSGPRNRKRRRRQSQDEEYEEHHENASKNNRVIKIPRTDASLYHAGQHYAPTDKRFGVIEKISMKNFMCHSHLEFVFAPRVNFIIGRNGSGKSAVLTAIMAALGGKTSATNRGNKSASFIQKGTTSARVEVTLANRGAHAYRPDEFGPSITVVRFIRQTGSQYEIRSHDRRVVSTKREDLAHILRQLNIQVDNPIVVLNQETSRNFLQSKSAKDKYQFFMKATQLEEVKENYRLAMEDYRLAKQTLDSKSSILNELEKRKTEYELQFKLLENIAREREKVKRLEGELAWSVVIAQEALLTEAARQVERIHSQLSRVQQEMDRFRGQMDTVEEDVTEKLQRLEAISTEKTERLREAESAKQLLSQLKEEFRTVEDEQKKLRREIRDIQGDRQALQNDIDRPQESNEKWRLEKARREKEIELTMLKINKLREGEPEARATEQAARQELNRAEGDVRMRRTAVQDLETQVQRLRRAIDAAKATRKDAINRFGPATGKVLGAIAAERRFRVPPKGPIGAFVSVKDDNWAYAVERHCSSTLTGWLVDNVEDCKLLKQILQRCNVNKVTLYTRRLGRPRYNCGPTVTEGSRCAMASMIDVKDDDVFNLLIDINRVHKVFLYDDTNRALADMKHLAGVPKGCTLALDSEYNRIFPAPSFRYFANDRAVQVKYLRRATEDALASLEQELGAVMKKESVAKRDLTVAMRAQLTAEGTVREARVVFKDITRSLAKYEDIVRQLKDFEEPIPVDHTPLLNEIKKMDEEVAAKETKLIAVQKHLDKAVAALRPANEALKQKHAGVQDSERRAQSLREEIDELQQRIRQNRNRLKDSESRKNGLEDTLKSLKQDQTVKERNLTALTEETMSKYPERVATRRREEQLRMELKIIQQQLIQMGREQPDPVKTKENYEMCIEKYRRLSAELEETNAYMVELSRLTEKRLNLYKTVRDLYCFLINTLFNSLMTYEKFQAELLFDHDAQTLDMHVPAVTAMNESVSRDVRGLSGGERSYSTVCLICSLWVNTASTPFRVLDEFDIFMDMSKRRKSLQMLLQVCQVQTGCQFIFLTPLEMPKLDTLKGDLVRIQMMPEPKRNNLTSSQT